MSSSFKNFISSKVFLVLGSVLLIFVLTIVFKQLNEKRSVEKEISDLSNQAKAIQQKNEDLHSLLAYLQTDDYKQKAAREQLSLKKDGEVVYSFSAQPQAEGSASVTNAQSTGPVSNPRSWWNYFFNPTN